ncbi:MAG: acyl-CoA dehydrogenase, N-terminal domain protein [Micavibrio sp.]|nr:acyl-CoA dehydrogenase, N-terminal domain protein [Micavibrio sp.]
MLGKFAYGIFEKANNGVSETQRTALKNGSVSEFESSITLGKPAWEGFLAEGNPTMTTEEQAFFDNETEEYCRLINDWDIRDARDIRGEAWEYAKKHKFFGLEIPKEYGGLGFSHYAHGMIMAKIASRSPTMGAATMVPNSLAGGELFVHYGTPEQKKYWLPKLSSGEVISCFCLTSPFAGSDATSLQDTGTVFKGEDGKLYIRLNLDKRYSTLAPIADLTQPAVQLLDPDNLLGKKDGITIVLLPRNTPGLSIGDRHFPLGSPFPNGPIKGKDIVVPMEQDINGVTLDTIMGGTDMAGEGWEQLTNCLLIGRAISLPASAAGSAQLATYVAGSYAAMRTQFGIPLAEMEGIQKNLAYMAGKTYMIDALRNGPLLDMDLANRAGQHYGSAVGSTISKLYATELAREVVMHGMDILAGKAVMDGPSNPLASAYLAGPTGITVEGANIMGENLMLPGMILTLGHPYSVQEMNIAEDVKRSKTTKQEAYGRAGPLFMKHAAYTVTNLFRSAALGLTHGWGSSTPHSGPDAPYYRHINRLSASFAYSLNVSMMLLGKDLQARQNTGARYGAVYSNLYIAGLVLRRWNAEGRRDDHRDVMEFAAGYCLHKAEVALNDLIRNHPRQLTKQEKGERSRLQTSINAMPDGMAKTVAQQKLAEIPTSTLAKAFIRPFVLPFGGQSAPPSDNIMRRVAVLTTMACDGRDVLTPNVYRPSAAQDPLSLMESAFRAWSKTRPEIFLIKEAQREKKVLKADNYFVVIADAVAKGVLTTDQGRNLEASYKEVLGVMLVDQFNGELSGPGAYGPIPQPAKFKAA